MPNTRVAQVFSTMAWAIHPAKLEQIKDVVSRHESGVKLDSQEIKNLIQSSDLVSNSGNREEANSPQIAIVPVLDTLMNRPTLFDAISGATSYEDISSQVLSAAAADDITHIVLDIESPGGEVNGIDAAAQAIREAAQKKPVIAVVNDFATSGAYWLASQASEIVVSNTSTVGSIGVLLAHMDYSAREEEQKVKTTIIQAGEDKSVGHPSRPLSEKDREKLQERVDTIHGVFISSIAQGRGMEVGDVKPLATGRTFFGEEAVKLGLADRIGTLSQEINQILSSEMSKDNDQKQKATAPQESANTNLNEIEQLKAAVSGLTQVVGTLVESNQIQAKAQAKERAERLIKPLIGSVLTPAQAYGSDEKPGLIAQATENYDFVAGVVENLKASAPRMAINTTGQVEQEMPSRAPAQGSVAEVFRQLGISDYAGNMNLSSVTLPLDQNGQPVSDVREAFYAQDRITPEAMQVQQQLTSFR